MKKFLYKIKQDFLAIAKKPPYSKNHDQKVDYDKYWEKRRRGDKPVLSSWQKLRADIILSMIKPKSKILDIGCGDGAVLDYLQKKADTQGLGVDISDKMFVVAKKAGQQVMKMDLNDFDNIAKLPQVDYILALEIMEHMANPEEFILNIKSKASKGMIISFPNTGYYVHRFRLLKGYFPVQWRHHPGEHLRFWTFKDAQLWTKQLGCQVDKILVYQGLPILNKILPNLFGQGILMKISWPKAQD